MKALLVLLMAGTIPATRIPTRDITGRGIPINALSLSIPLGNAATSSISVVGTIAEKANTQSGDYATDFAVSNQHVYIYVDAITTGGDLVITGTSLSESTAVPVTTDTETITLDTSADQYWQSHKKWLEVTNIDVSSGAITGIDYDIGVVGYPDYGNMDFAITGFRIDAVSSGVNADMAFRIQKVQDDGGKKMSIVDLEYIGIDAAAAGEEVIDYIRTGGNERSYTPTVGSLWPANSVFTFKQLDFETFFTADENEFNCSSGDEGIVVTIEANSGNIANVNNAEILLYWREN